MPLRTSNESAAITSAWTNSSSRKHNNNNNNNKSLTCLAMLFALSTAVFGNIHYLFNSNTLTVGSQSSDHLSAVYECQSLFGAQNKRLQVVLLQHDFSRPPSVICAWDWSRNVCCLPSAWTPHFAFPQQTESQMSQRAQIAAATHCALLRDIRHAIGFNKSFDFSDF